MSNVELKIQPHIQKGHTPLYNHYTMINVIMLVFTVSSATKILDTNHTIAPTIMLAHEDSDQYLPAKVVLLLLVY